jgi:hypothetical protein
VSDFEAVVTCPWCSWRTSLHRTTYELAVRDGSAELVAHCRRAGHRVKPGAKPRIGYYRGEPIA